jgi:hypothetical protein
MKFFFMKFIMILALQVLHLESKAQLLNPDELSALLLPNSAKITAILTEKGFEYNELVFTNVHKETQESWYFNPLHSSGEKPNALIIRLMDSTQAIKIQYLLYNPYHYKQLVQSLIKEKYRFEGVIVTGRYAGNIFKKDKTTFTTSTLFAINGQPYYHIIIQ